MHGLHRPEKHVVDGSAGALVILLPAVLVPARDLARFSPFPRQILISQGGGMGVSALVQSACHPLGFGRSYRIDRHEGSVE